MRISLVVAYDENYVIGNNNELPWHIPEDLKWFKEITKNKTVCMGLNTWYSLPEKVRPLPGRKNIIVSSSASYKDDIPDDVIIFRTHIDLLLYAYMHNEDIYVMGGSKLYESVLPYANKLYITYVYGKHRGDTYFPEFNIKEWFRISRKKYETHESCIYIKKVNRRKK